MDLDFVRAQFPALETPWTLLDNAGGSAPCRQVIERVASHMSRVPVQLGASYELSERAGAAVAEGRRAAACLVGAQPTEVVLGPSSTQLAQGLARSLVEGWRPGDEVVVTNLDHEANIGPWRRLEERGIVLREWRVREEDCHLHEEDLVPLLNARTRLVAFTHTSNVVGTVLDVPRIAALVREAGALSCVDGVAHAPHRHVDVKALGVDFYLVSLYKVFGPHLGLLFGREELLRGARGSGHFFQPDDSLSAKFEPGNVNYELSASLVGILEYLGTLLDPRASAPWELDLAACFERIVAHESELVRPLLEFLEGHPRARLLGVGAQEVASRVPTVSFVVAGRASAEIPPLLEERRIAVRYGHFYAYRLIRDLGLLERDGVVRISFSHYNTPAEVSGLLEALDELL